MAYYLIGYNLILEKYFVEDIPLTMTFIINEVYFATGSLIILYIMMKGMAAIYLQ
jgi:hypothetical protein